MTIITNNELITLYYTTHCYAARLNVHLPGPVTQHFFLFRIKKLQLKLVSENQETI